MKGNAICRTSNDKYRDGWDRVFGGEEESVFPWNFGGTGEAADVLKDIMKEAKKINDKSKLFPMYHKYGHTACGGVAIYTKTKVVKGDITWASNVVLVDGTTPVSGDIVRCGSCLKGFSGFGNLSDNK